MKPRTSLGTVPAARLELQEGARVAVIGGGPAGAFFCLHLLRKARALGRTLQVTVFERRRCAGAAARPPCGGAWHGCNYCAGGLSPKLNDVLDSLNLKVPEAVIQNQIHSVTIQGFWKNIELEVPAQRRMVSVFRGSRPGLPSHPTQSFDSFLLDQALAEGATLIQGEVVRVTRSAEGKPVVHHRAGGARGSLERSYGPTLRRFSRNNRFASLVFFLHRFFFTSSVLSRVLYQAVITERKSTPAGRRQLEQILWRIASGGDEYEDIFWGMLRSAAIWPVLTGGALVTLRNYFTELASGVRWEGLGRFTTGVSLERLAEKRREFGRLAAQANIAVPADPEFERIYTIKLAAPRERILDQLENFGEADRGGLRPRGVRIRRVAGEPHAAGCVIRYEIGSSRFCFHLRLERVFEGHLAVYRVMDGFARGGVLLFEIESDKDGMCLLSIYVAFRFARGRNRATRLLWRLFRLLFPPYVHDVLWNHSLCQMRDLVETQREPGGAQGKLEPDYQI